MAAIYRQEIIQNVTLFTSQGATRFYDKLFNSLEFTIPRAATGRLGFPKEALICAFIVMKCEKFLQITDLVDYLNNNRLIAYYCGFDIMKPLPSYWTYDRFLKKLNNAQMKKIMVELVKQLYNRGIVDASFIGLDSTPVMANTRQNNSKAFMKNKFSKEVSPKSDPDCALGVHSASNQHSERRYEFYGVTEPRTGGLYLRTAFIRTDYACQHYRLHRYHRHPGRSRPDNPFAGCSFQSWERTTTTTTTYVRTYSFF